MSSRGIEVPLVLSQEDTSDTAVSRFPKSEKCQSTPAPVFHGIFIRGINQNVFFRWALEPRFDLGLELSVLPSSLLLPVSRIRIRYPALRVEKTVPDKFSIDAKVKGAMANQNAQAAVMAGLQGGA